MNELNVAGAFIVGLLGGVHCLGMCGGIVGALTLGQPQQNAATSGFWLLQLGYNLGRILSYMLAGMTAGGLGLLLAQAGPLQYTQQILSIVAGLFMIMMGLYLGGWWTGLARVERAGGVVWKRIEPLGRRLLPVRSPAQAFLLGMVWGWLPCGLVYSVLIWALSAGGMVDGALLMGAFGLGTLPNLLLMGAAAGWMGSLLRKPLARKIAGGLVILFGIMMLLQLRPMF
ncbi:sulfite exporter TauE/SafE family protein [Thiolapillus sp.]